MKKRIIAGCIAAAALCVIVLPRVLKKEAFAEKIEAPVVEIGMAQVRDITLTSSLTGTIEPEEVVYIYPKASGEVKEVAIKSGDYVNAGQLLCIVDTKQVDTAKSSLDSAELALKKARDELSRQTLLYHGGGLSEQLYQQYQDSVASAEITYNNAKINYDNQVSYSCITAPITGIVENCDMEVFDQVTQSNQICVISGEGARIVSFSATERIREQLQEGDQITLEKNGKSYTGKIYEISSMADASTGLFAVKARLDAEHTDTGLTTGSVVKLYVTSGYAEQVVAVPVDSVYYDGGAAYVYTYDSEKGCLYKVQVETGMYDSEWIEISGGLEADTAVLTTWSSELYDGVSVRAAGEAAEIETQADQKQ